MPGDGPIGQPCSCRTFHVSKEVSMNQSNIFGTRSIIKGFILIRSRHLKSIARPPALQHSVVRLKAGGGWQQKVDAGIPFLSRVLYIYEDCSQVMLGCALRCYDPDIIYRPVCSDRLLFICRRLLPVQELAHLRTRIDRKRSW